MIDDQRTSAFLSRRNRVQMMGMFMRWCTERGLGQGSAWAAEVRRRRRGRARSILVVGKGGVSVGGDDVGIREVVLLDVGLLVGHGGRLEEMVKLHVWGRATPICTAADPSLPSLP